MFRLSVLTAGIVLVFGCVEAVKVSAELDSIEISVVKSELFNEIQELRFVVKTENKGEEDICEFSGKYGQTYDSDPYIKLINPHGKEVYSNFEKVQIFQDSPMFPEVYGITVYRARTEFVGEYRFWSDDIDPIKSQLSNASLQVGRKLFLCSNLDALNLGRSINISDRKKTERALSLWRESAVLVTSNLAAILSIE